MTVLEAEKSFNEFVAKEVTSALYYVSGLFTMVTSMCEYCDEEDVARLKATPSTALIPQKKKEHNGAPKGLFALSFEKIPCDEPIKPCQFRTGRRYIQADNFPDDDGLDHYLGLMDKLSSTRMHVLNSNDSNLSFDFASEDHLEFQLLTEQFAELFVELDDAMLQALKTYYPLQVEFLQNMEIDLELIQDYFTFPNGEQDLEILQEMIFYVRALAEDGKDLATLNPQITPKGYEEFLEMHCALDNLLYVPDALKQ